MTNAPGTKKKTAAMTQRLIDDGPLWPAAAIQRGPSTVAMLKSRTSQKPMVLRSWDFESSGAGAVVIGSPRGPCAATGNHTAPDLRRWRAKFGTAGPRGQNVKRAPNWNWRGELTVFWIKPKLVGIVRLEMAGIPN